MHLCIITGMAKKSKHNLRTRSASATADPGRVAQRNRTRKAIVDATMQLMASGRTPSIAEIIQAAQVSRRTVYMYFPTIDQLLLDATLGAIGQQSIDPVINAAESTDPAERVEQLSRAINGSTKENMHLGRALIRLTIEGAEPSSGGPRRGYRRVGWIERALEPVRAKLSPQEFERLVSALTVLMGWEPMIVLKDLRGLETKEAEDVLAFAARAVVEATLKTHTEN
jgi:AcrR family transcriptional regulator